MALCIIVVIAVQLIPLIKQVVNSAGDESDMVHYIDSYGLKGIPLLMGLQALQIIVAFIPATAVQILTGLCYGVFFGTLISLAGSVLGNALIVSAIRHMHNLLAPLLKRDSRRKGFLSKESLAKIKRPEVIVFFLFLIPAIPNGIVPYVLAETDIPLGKYLLAVTAGCIPSTFICTLLGERVSKGSFGAVAVIAAVVIVIALTVLLFRKKIMAFITQSGGNKE